jgi:hypothetical protein
MDNLSVDIPKLTIALGDVGIPQGDIVEARVHLGATKEVSSWELLLQNWNSKYSPSGTYPLSVGQDGYICIGRGANVPQVITTRTENIKYESSPTENYVRVAGRCWGEKLFRQVVTKTYSNQKGEAIVKDLLDFYSGLSHVRNSTELVEDTDTTFTLLEYKNTPVWDILRAMADACDDGGIIGYDFRIAPDAKFEFFPRNSKTSPVSLGEKIEESAYSKDISRVRNKITIYGAPEKSSPADKFAAVESLTPTEGAWTAVSGSVILDSSKHYSEGSASIKNSTGANYYGASLFTFGPSYIVDAEKFATLFLVLARDSTLPGDFSIALFDTAGRSAQCQVNQIGDDKWVFEQLKVGSAYTDQWAVEANFDWTHIWRIEVIGWCEDATPGNFWVGQVFFGGCRYSSLQEDSTSQSAYGLRVYVDTDEELYSDNECVLRAKAILASLKDPAEYLTVRSTVVDYGNTPLLAGDKINIVLPNENVNADFRILSAEYFVDARIQTLEITLELGREIPLLADYVYALRSKIGHINRYKKVR